LQTGNDEGQECIPLDTRLQLPQLVLSYVLQNWNGQCAECHSTGLSKGYDPEGDSYATTWSEIDVSCEACHGPGSAHVAWAREAAGADENGDKGLAVDLTSGARSIVSDIGTPNGQNAFVVPIGIALDDIDNRALVVDDGLEALLAVDLESGQRVIFSR